MSEAKFVGGSKRDREQILQLHADYIDANARFDWGKLEPIWSPAPEAVFFNLNGHTYKGREHWFRLWKFYGQTCSRATGRRSTSAASCPTTWRWSGAIAAPNAIGPARRRRPRTSTMAAMSSSPARPWCSARKAAVGASCTRIFPKQVRASAPAAYDALSLP